MRDSIFLKDENKNFFEESDIKKQFSENNISDGDTISYGGKIMRVFSTKRKL